MNLILSTTICSRRHVARLRNLLAPALLSLNVAGATTDKWVAFDVPGTSTNDGSTREKAAPFTVAKVNKWLTDPSLTDLTVHFIPSAIPATLPPPFDAESESEAAAAWHFVLTGPLHNDRLIIQTGPAPRKVRLVGDTSYGYRPVLRLGPSADASGWLSGSPRHDWLLQTHLNGIDANSDYLESVEIRDLVLDGDFEGQGAFTSAANAGGYKSSALNIGAKTGRIQNVLVRRFGSMGRVPVTYFGTEGAGTESFPVSVWTRVADKTLANNSDDLTYWNPYPWLIQDVEVSGGRARHGGYGTQIMAVVRDDTVVSATSSIQPIIAVRKCRVLTQQNAIAFGTAGSNTQFSDRILFEDNVALNSNVCLNTDTGVIGWITLRRNAFLDVLGGFSLGVAGAGSGGPALHDHYTIENNLIRLRGRANVGIYRAWDETPTGVDSTDPNLPLGRLYSSQSWVLMLNGRAGNVAFQNNWITTWPVNGTNNLFFLPSLGTVPPPEFRIVWSLPPNTFIDTVLDYRDRAPSSVVTLQGCQLSTRALEFGSGVVPDAVNAVPLLAASRTATGRYAGSYSPGYQDLKTPPAMGTTGPNRYVFVPRGLVERVQAEFDGQDHLQTVWEVMLGPCTVSGNTVSGTVRLMKHGLPGTAAPGTSTPAGLTVRISGELVSDGVTVPLQSDNGKANVTDTNGVAGFAVALVPVGGGSLPANGVLKIRAWYDKDSPRAPATTFEPRRHAWSSLAVPTGTVVDVVATPDVADDKNTSAGKRAKFRVRRNPKPDGTWNGLPALAVRLQLVDTGILRPADEVNLTAAYGTTSSKDYYLTGGGWPGGTVALNSPQTVTIPAGQEYVELTVIPIPDNLTESNVAALQVAPAIDGSYSTKGLTDRAEVMIYDGPEWTLYELSLSNFGGPTSLSAAYAINNKSGTTEPRISGTGTYMAQDQYSNYVPVSYGGWWQWPNSGSFTPIYNTPYYGLSTSPVKLVGWQGAHAYVTSTSTAGFTYLPDLYAAAGQATTAWGINPSSTWIVGSSKNSGAHPRPVAWSSALNISDLGGSAGPTQEGYAKAVNDQNQVVGQFNVQYTGGDAGAFAFRTKPGASPYPIEFHPDNGAGDVLHAKGLSGSDNAVGEATWLAADGRAVGWSKNEFDHREATYWAASSTASSVAAVGLAGWQSQSGGLPEAYSVAKCINASGWIVGWSGATDIPSRAVLKRSVSIEPKSWQDLNDRLLIHGYAGWVLKSADAINDLNYIIGNGTLYGQPRAFLLVPRTPGN